MIPTCPEKAIIEKYRDKVFIELFDSGFIATIYSLTPYFVFLKLDKYEKPKHMYFKRSIHV